MGQSAGSRNVAQELLRLEAHRTLLIQMLRLATSQHDPSVRQNLLFASALKLWRMGQAIQLLVGEVFVEEILALSRTMAEVTINAAYLQEEAKYFSVDEGSKAHSVPCGYSRLSTPRYTSVGALDERMSPEDGIPNVPGVLSVDLALSSNRLGICSLSKDKAAWTVRFIEPAKLNIREPLESATLALALYEYCRHNDLNVLLIDGPQAWKSPHSNLLHCRECEHALHTPAKTGTKGNVKPKPASRFVEFSIDLFTELFTLGAHEVLCSNIEVTPGILAAESFPTAAWRALGQKPLPSRRHASDDEVRQRCDWLRQRFGVKVNGNPTHDELQALVAGLAGMSILEGGNGHETVGAPTIMVNGDRCEGYIVNLRPESPTAKSNENPAPPKYIRDLVFERLRLNHAENTRLEWKRQLEVSNPHQKAEFIRDILSLANSEGECPRTPGHLLIGAKDGKTFNAEARIDGATLGQIVEAYISPTLPFEHSKVPVEDGQYIDVLEVRPGCDSLYVVAKELRDEHKPLLRPGESYGRRGDRKVSLTGDDICRRIEALVQRKADAIAAPLRSEISELREAVAAAGPRREAVRLVYDLEHHVEESDWDQLSVTAQKLYPYLRDEQKSVANVVLERIGHLLRVRFGMPAQAAKDILGIAANALPPRSHQGPSSPVTEEELLQYEAAASIADEAAYDSIKYAENLVILEAAGQLLRGIGRVAHLNHCRQLASKVKRTFDRLRELAVKAGDDFVQVVDYFDGESRLANPDLPPVFNKIYRQI